MLRINPIYILAGVLMFALCGCVPVRAVAESIEWVHSYDQALEKAKAEKKAIMADFYTDWCSWCKKLDRETYEDEKVIAFSRKLVCLKIDADKEQALARRYGVRGYPTILFLDPAGSVIGGSSGFKGAPQLLSEMEKAASLIGNQ